MAWTDIGLALPTGHQGMAAAIFNGKLYVSTSVGELYESNNLGAFSQVIASNSNNIKDLLVFNSKLYGFTEQILFEWDGVASSWTNVGDLGSPVKATNLMVRSGEIYVGHFPGSNLMRISKWNGSNAFTLVATGSAFGSGSLRGGFCASDNNLYWGDGGSTTGKLWRYNGTSVDLVAPQFSGTYPDSYPFEYNGVIYGVMRNSDIFQWNGSNAWVGLVAGVLGSSAVVQGRGLLLRAGTVYYGSDQTGTAGGKLGQWLGGASAFLRCAQLNSYNSVRTLFEYNGRLLALINKTGEGKISEYVDGGTASPSVKALTLTQGAAVGAGGAAAAVTAQALTVAAFDQNALTLGDLELLLPEDGAVLRLGNPEFSWLGLDESGIIYELQVATEPTFADPVLAINLEETKKQVALDFGFGYYWRVRARSGDLYSAWAGPRTLGVPGLIPAVEDDHEQSGKGRMLSQYQED